MANRWLLLLPLVLSAAARGQQVPPAALQTPEEKEDEEEKEPERELGPLMFSAGIGYSAFVFNQSASDVDPTTVVATPGLAVHVEAGPRLGAGSSWGLVAAGTFAVSSADVISHYTSGIAMLAVGARYDEGEGMRITLGLGAGGILLRRLNGDHKALSFAPFFHVDYPPPLFPPWLHLQGTFSYMPVPAPLRAFVAGVGVGVVL